MSNLIAWIIRAIPFGTIIMFGSMGEITTEKSGNLNLGVPGIMYLGGFAGFASSYFYEKNAADPKGWICVLLALTAAIAASMLGGLIFSFLTITLRANQNVTGLALTTFGMGVANFFGVFIQRHLLPMHLFQRRFRSCQRSLELSVKRYFLMAFWCMRQLLLPLYFTIY